MTHEQAREMEAMAKNPNGRGFDAALESGMRQVALEHAVATHANTVDEGQIVAAAEAYLAFLLGQKPAEK